MRLGLVTDVHSHADELARALQILQNQLANLGEDNPLAQLSERVGDLVLSLDRIADVDDLEGVYINFHQPVARNPVGAITAVDRFGRLGNEAILRLSADDVEGGYG